MSNSWSWCPGKKPGGWRRVPETDCCEMGIGHRPAGHGVTGDEGVVIDEHTGRGIGEFEGAAAWRVVDEVAVEIDRPPKMGWALSAAAAE